MDLFHKCTEYYPIVDRAKKAGYYPYFIPLNSEPDRRVTIHGKELIMLGSNNYLGLTTHPKVKEAGGDSGTQYETQHPSPARLTPAQRPRPSGGCGPRTPVVFAAGPGTIG